MPKLRLTSENSTGGSNGTDGTLNLATRVTCSASGAFFNAFVFRFGGTSGTVEYALWDTATGAVVPGTHLTGVSVVSGWNRTDLPAPVALVPGREYEIAVFMGGVVNFWQATSHFSSPKVRGPLTFSGSRFLYSATFARPTSSSNTFYYIDGEFDVPTSKTFTGTDGSWTFDYANEAALLADGWTFTSPGAVDTTAGTETYTGTGVQFPLTSTSILSGSLPANTLFRALPEDWRSIQLKMLFAPTGSGDVGKHAGLGLMMADNDFMHFRIDYAGQPLLATKSVGDLVGGGNDLDQRGYDLRSWPTARWLRIDRELDGHLTVLWSLNGVDWLTTYKDSANLTLATYNENIDADTFFITGGGGTGLNYTVQEVIVAGEPTPPAEVGSLVANGAPATLIVDGDVVSAAYMDGEQVYVPTMAGEYVAFSVAGVSFRPEIELAGGSTAQCYWTLEDNRVFATGLTPSVDLEVYQEREVRLFVTDGGVSAFADVTVLNLGYDNLEDPGIYGPGAAYNHPPQPVTAITNLQALTGLTMFMAAHSTLDTIDFSGMADLLFIECFHAEVQAVDLTGCTSLQRLCLESCRVSYLDLNPVAATLLDLRGAVQRHIGGTLELEPMGSELPNLYHYCVRDQGLTYTIPNDLMPALEQRWDWFTGRTFIDTPVPPLLTSYMTQGNAYPQAVVNAILVSLDTNNAPAPGGWARLVDLSGSAAPSGAGSTAKTSLIGKGWTVTTA